MAVLLLVSCDNSSEPQFNNENSVISKLGVLEIKEYYGGNRNAEIQSEFGAGSDSTSTAIEIMQSIRPDTDQCVVGAENNFEHWFGHSSVFSTISAGTELTLKDSSGMTWLMPKNDVNGYSPETNDFPYPLPGKLSIDIPGDTFPAMSNVIIPELSSLKGLEPDQPLKRNINAKLSWIASDQPNARVVLHINSSISNNPPLTCILLDDGEFELSDKMKEEFSPIYSDKEMLLSRVMTTFVQNKDSLLIVNHSIINVGINQP